MRVDSGLELTLVGVCVENSVVGEGAVAVLTARDVVSEIVFAGNFVPIFNILQTI